MTRRDRAIDAHCRQWGASIAEMPTPTRPRTRLNGPDVQAEHERIAAERGLHAGVPVTTPNGPGVVQAQDDFNRRVALSFGEDAPRMFLVDVADVWSWFDVDHILPAHP